MRSPLLAETKVAMDMIQMARMLKKCASLSNNRMRNKLGRLILQGKMDNWHNPI